MKKNAILLNIASPLLSVILALIIFSIVLIVLKYPVLDTFYSIFIEPFTTYYDFFELITKASFLICIALGLSIGFKANVWNIGAEGQFIFGAICGSVVAIYFIDSEGWFIIPLMIIASIMGGVLWVALPAWFKVSFDTNEILTSLMLVYIAELLLVYLVHGHLKDMSGFNFPQSVYFSESARFPYLIEGTRLSIAPIVALILFPIGYVFMYHSFFGFQIRVFGSSVKSAKYAGYSSKKIVWFSFLVSGGLAGFVGISEVAGNIHQLVPDISPGYGFTAIIVAFLGRLNPIGILFSGLLMSLIYIGSEIAQITIGIPISIGYLFQGLLLFCLLSCDYFILKLFKIDR